jgi:hypothetical protein
MAGSAFWAERPALRKTRISLAGNQQRRRAEIIPGGVAVELEIAMPQFRYVAQAKQMVRSRPIPIPVIAAFGRSSREVSRFFWSDSGFPLQPTKTVRVISKGIQRRNCA